jgi:hypothetical protein
MPEMMMSMGMKKSKPSMAPVMEMEMEKARMKHLCDARPRVAHVAPGAGAGVLTGGAAHPRWHLGPRRKKVRGRRRVRRVSKGQKR